MVGNCTISPSEIKCQTIIGGSRAFSPHDLHHALDVVRDGVCRRDCDVVELKAVRLRFYDVIYGAATGKCAVGVVVHLADARRDGGAVVVVGEARTAVHHKGKSVRRLADALDHIDG